MLGHSGLRNFDAERHRFRAELFLLTRQIDDAEDSYNNTLETARRQRVRLRELTGSSGLARLLRDQRRGAAALNILSLAHSSLSEGFDTEGMQGANALLDDL